MNEGTAPSPPSTVQRSLSTYLMESSESTELPSNHGDHIINVMSNDRFYDFILKGRRDLVIIDVGANIGLFSVYAHDCAKMIYALEPTPSHFAILQELTKNYANITPLNVALSNTNEEVDLHLIDGNSTMNSLVNSEIGGRTVKVPGRTLLSVIKEFNLEKVDFVKCDIEGSEMKALTNKTISEVSGIVDAFHVEAHAAQGRGGDTNREKLEAIFRANGYTVDTITNDDFHAYKKGV